MCIVLSEDALVELSKTPSRLAGILATDDSVAVEIRRFEEGTSRHFSYCIVDMTKEELYQYALKVRKSRDKANAAEECLICLEKLDINNSIWYKYFEEKYATTEPSNHSQLLSKGTIMDNGNTTNETKSNETATTTGKFNWGNALKMGGFGTLLVLCGAGAGYYAGKKAGVKTVTQPM
jgi:hypothetical protein